MGKKLLIELPYLGNLAFYQLLTNFDEILIEHHEFFEKASFRNRCEIVGPNGKLVLSIPVTGGKHKKQHYKETKICYDHTWLKDHWNSFTSCYRRSPYFEFYEDKFEIIFDKELEDLYDLNLELFKLTLSLLKLDVPVSLTESYQKEHDGYEDYRSFFLPRKKQSASVKYMQVFEDRTGFINNLSIVDLLFNEGPNAINVLKSK
jgi:hypothetical protein